MIMIPHSSVLLGLKAKGQLEEAKQWVEAMEGMIQDRGHLFYENTL